MANERKTIRDTFKAVVETQFAGTVYTSRVVNPDGLDDYVNVFFVEGEGEYAGLQPQISAVVAVGYHKTGTVTDDDLDAVAELINSAIVSKSDWPDPMFGVTGAGFEYPDEQEHQFSTIYLKFNVQYQEA